MAVDTFYFNGSGDGTNGSTGYVAPDTVEFSLNATNEESVFAEDGNLATIDATPVGLTPQEFKLYIRKFGVATYLGSAIEVPTTLGWTEIDATSILYRFSVSEIKTLLQLIVMYRTDYDNVINQIVVSGTDLSSIPSNASLTGLQVRVKSYLDNDIWYIDAIEVNVDYVVASVTDAGSAWTDDANAFDGDTATSASTNSSGSSNALIVTGTNAPPDFPNTVINSVTVRTHSGGAWSSATTVNAPTGGWTWEKINGLIVELYHFSGSIRTVVKDGTSTLALQQKTYALPNSVSKVELSVDYTETETNTYYFDGSGSMEIPVDSYSESSTDGFPLGIDFETFRVAVGQSFTGNGSNLSRVQFYIAQSNSSATGELTAYVYAHSGTFGTDGVPTGSPLATSETVDASSLTTSLSLVDFEFPTPYYLDSGTNYVVVIAHTSGTWGVVVARDASSPTHSGNGVINTGSWSSDSSDFIFYVYGEVGIYDPDSAWSNDANAFDGDVETMADTSGLGSKDSRYLHGIGTNAPSSGGGIVQVRAEITEGYGSATYPDAVVGTSGWGEELGEISMTGFVSLSEPDGGWTWDKIRNLEVKGFYPSSTGIGTISLIELEVTSEASSADTSTIEKSLTYTVISTPATIEKPLAYFIKRDDLIQKNIIYTVTDTNLIQKAISYSVTSTPSAITKGISYAIRSTPSAIQKAIAYTVSHTPTAITKALAYGVDYAPPPSSIFSPAVGGFMVGQYWTAQTTSTITEIIQKSLEYAIAGGETISKSLTYVVAGSGSITKSLTYAVLSHAIIQKGLVYAVAVSDTIQKSVQYIIRSSPVIQKTLSYTVASAATVQKTLAYTVTTFDSITKSITYAVVSTPSTITKSLSYMVVRTPATITKLLTYSVVGESAIIQKTIEYKVVVADTIQKSLQYAVTGSQTIQKNLTYYLTSTTYSITKGLEYRVIPVTTIAKNLAYTVLTTPATITKSVEYKIVTNDTIQKSLQYIIQSTTAIEKSLEYRVLTTPSAITKSLAYFIGRPITITKDLAYKVKMRYPKPPVTKVEEIKSRWMSVENQKPPKTIVE